jgi:hypothetical protein
VVSNIGLVALDDGRWCGHLSAVPGRTTVVG